MKVSCGELTNLTLVTKRDFSNIYKAEFGGQTVCLKKLKPCHRFSMDFYKQSYKNYDQLVNKSNLVKVIEHYQDGDEYIIIMEWIDGKRIEYGCGTYTSLSMQGILLDLMQQGYINLDFAPINFMIKNNIITMIDLDTIVKISDLEENPQKADFNWSWFGSRYGKFLRTMHL